MDEKKRLEITADGVKDFNAEEKESIGEVAFVAMLTKLVTGKTPDPVDIRVPAPDIVQDAVKHICAQAKIKEPDFVGITVGEAPDNASISANEEGKIGLFVGIGFWKLPTRFMYAILAHELGHLNLGHSRPEMLAKMLDLYNTDRDAFNAEKRKQEVEADDFAKKLGMGTALADALSSMSDIPKDKECECHPAINTRISRLRGES